MAEHIPQKRKKRRSLLRRIGEADSLTRFAGRSAARYLRFVRNTSTLTFEPGDPYEEYGHYLPAIIAMWHGQHLMMPFIRRPGHDVRVMISRHRDGEINAIAAESLGIGTIRASAARDPSRIVEKGALRGFLEMKTALAEGATVAMTADLSNVVARRVGLGIIMLGRASGRPIVPVAVATSRYFDIESWDRMTVNLPFSKAVCIFEAPVFVPEDADEAMMEEKRQEVQRGLDLATERAYAAVGAKHG